MEFETVIGLEVHVQLSTASKIFCSSSAAFGGAPNEFIDPVTLGLPGALPVVNRRCVDFAIMMGLALNCEIRRFNRFARKHYFYPDLPKGYQISQYDEPICERGHVEILHDGVKRSIGITRIHMEEDAGKNIHDVRTNASLIDLNRAGVGLLEVVSEPDIRSPAEAAAYLRVIRQLVRYLGVSDGNMEEGSLRCDANVSLRPTGSAKFGTRTEIKNLNSFKFVERALEYEIARQTSVLKSGQAVVQETVLFDSATGTTRTLRSKEQAADYRYFPDPDLPPLVVEESWVASVRERMPQLPHDLVNRYVNTLGLSPYDAGVLTAEREISEFFETVLTECGNPKAACNWITSELFGLLNKDSKTITESPVSARSIGALIKMVQAGDLNGKMAKAVFEEMYQTGKSPDEIVAARGLKTINDDSVIEKAVADVIAANPGQVSAYKGGKESLLGFFVGQVMKSTKGAANPQRVNELVLAALKR